MFTKRGELAGSDDERELEVSEPTIQALNAVIGTIELDIKREKDLHSVCTWERHQHRAISEKISRLEREVEICRRLVVELEAV